MCLKLILIIKNSVSYNCTIVNKTYRLCSIFISRKYFNTTSVNKMQDRSSSPELFESPRTSPPPPEKHDTKIKDKKEWRGTPMSDILRDNNPWNHYTSTINPSRHHTVLFELPITLTGAPKPHYSSNIEQGDTCHWNSNCVKMPFSERNLYPVKEGNEEVIKKRWNIIQKSLLQPISSSIQLQEAIFSYNLRHNRFETLHYFLQEALEENESEFFFNALLPKIIQLALQLPELMPSPIPLLKQGKAHAVSLSQLQIACLLANAFLCTFPWRKDMGLYPGINFNRLFESKSRQKVIVEKIKCLLHYFRRVCNKTPIGVVTFERKFVSKVKLPRWDRLDDSIANTKLHISSSDTIEDGGLGLLQVDFANCMVGGGVLHSGCVQEEIRFIVCPELIISRLFTEQLGPTEALQIIGVERFSKYRGYAESFEWAGNYDDQTPFDLNGRRRTSVVAIDALYYSKPSVQFCPSKLIRELNKAYVGFHEEVGPGIRLPAVATGNWGCGVFNGNLHLKSLLQIMACTAAKRDIVYYTFGDEKLRDTVFSMHHFLVDHKVTVCQLWRYLCRFNEAQLPSKHLFSYIQQAHLDTLKSPTTSLTKMFANVGQNSKENTSTTHTKSVSPKEPIDVEMVEEGTSLKESWSQDSGIIESSQDPVENNYINPAYVQRSKLKRNEEECKKNHKQLKKFLYSTDEEESQSEKKDDGELLFCADKYFDKPEVNSDKTEAISPDNSVCEQMDISPPKEEEKKVSTPKKNIPKQKPVSNKKISDYFKVIPK